MTGILSTRLEGIVEHENDEKNPMVQIDELVSLDGLDENSPSREVSGKKNELNAPEL